ncbi:MAG TPA: RecX family transcriptional regulator [Bryobacteraceae bacterium]|jgi:regulatory protein|nr:RecX family transcriptional regulator [Bryobacteraceae bacterium]
MAKRQPQPLDRDKLLNVALRALGGRAHSSGELREKLRRRAQSDEDVDAVLAKLKESGYLNDRRFAENYASARLQNQGLGKIRVLRDLRQRRVAPKLAEQVTEKTYEQTDEAKLIEEFLLRKFRGKQLPAFLSEAKNLAGAFRRLRYAGFSAGQSIRVLKRFANQPEASEVLDALEFEEPEEREEK